MNNEQAQFVDSVYDELSKLFNKDKNPKKSLLGNDPILTIFDQYSDWLVNNFSLSPKVAANEIYKDVIAVQYYQFGNKRLKRGVQLKNKPSFNTIYGSQKEIDEANKILKDLEAKNPKKHQLVVTALTKIKQMADKVKPEKNLFGKTKNVAKQNVATLQQMPRFGTLKTLISKNEKELTDYINKFTTSLNK